MRIPKIDDLEMAIEAESASGFGEIRAYISKITGEVVMDAEEVSGEKCPMEDIEFHGDYIRVPSKRDLDLGQRLVWKFVEREIPGLYDRVREIFSRRGAYRRYKDFLEYNGILETWYNFESDEMRGAVLDWCDEHQIPIRAQDTAANGEQAHSSCT